MTPAATSKTLTTSTRDDKPASLLPALVSPTPLPGAVLPCVASLALGHNIFAAAPVRSNSPELLLVELSEGPHMTNTGHARLPVSLYAV